MSNDAKHQPVRGSSPSLGPRIQNAEASHAPTGGYDPWDKLTPEMLARLYDALLNGMGHTSWIDAWREAADWRDQYRADREDGIELLKDMLAWNFESIPPGFAARIEGYISRVERNA